MKSGFICIAGLPNAGKSTLINTLVGEKVAIVSWRPQTSRNNILTTPNLCLSIRRVFINLKTRLASI